MATTSEQYFEMADEAEQHALELSKGRKLDPADSQIQLASYYAKLAEWFRRRASR